MFLYQYCRDQGYEIFNGVYVCCECDYEQIIGYDDCNQFFWYFEGIECIVFEDKIKFVDVFFVECYFKFKDVNWKKCFFKIYKEMCFWFYFFVNFNCIWIIYLIMFWFYMVYNFFIFIIVKYE